MALRFVNEYDDKKIAPIDGAEGTQSIHYGKRGGMTTSLDSPRVL